MPNNDIRADHFNGVNRMNKAILEMERALELDPLSSWHRCTLALWKIFEGEFDRAIEISQETLEINPNNAWGLGNIAMAWAGKGMYDKAVSICQGLRNIPYYEGYLGYLYGKAGNIEEAQKILEDFLARSKKGYYSPYMIAMVYSGLGDNDKVFEWLDRAFDVRDPIQFSIKLEPSFAELHSDPRWTEQMKKRGLAD